jgi:hypothetical protein
MAVGGAGIRVTGRSCVLRDSGGSLVLPTRARIEDDAARVVFGMFCGRGRVAWRSGVKDWGKLGVQNPNPFPFGVGALRRPYYQAGIRLPDNRVPGSGPGGQTVKKIARPRRQCERASTGMPRPRWGLGAGGKAPQGPASGVAVRTRPPTFAATVDSARPRRAVNTRRRKSGSPSSIPTNSQPARQNGEGIRIRFCTPTPF